MDLLEVYRDHPAVVVEDVCRDVPLVVHDGEDHVVEGHDAAGHVEAAGVVDNGRMEVEEDGGTEDAYDCLSRDMYDCHENGYHAGAVGKAAFSNEVSYRGASSMEASYLV